MNQRRRFFPMQAVQTEPGRTVELAVQVRKEVAQVATAPGPAPGPGPGSGMALTWLPVCSRPYGSYEVIDEGGGALTFQEFGHITARFEGDGALEFQSWPGMPANDGVVTSAMPIASASWRCTRVDLNLYNWRPVVLQGVLLGTPAETNITWDLQWSDKTYVYDENHIPVLAPSAPGYADSKTGHAASAAGALITVVPAYVIDGMETPEEVLTATAYVDGAAVGVLVVSIVFAGY